MYLRLLLAVPYFQALFQDIFVQTPSCKLTSVKGYYNQLCEVTIDLYRTSMYKN